jgi:hypothetical protein
MNERIKELAEYAWEFTTEQTDGWINESGKVNWDFLHAYDKKFAELIVRECLTAIDKTDTTHIYTSFDQSMVMGTIEKSKKAIKEHFGVKE